MMPDGFKETEIGPIPVEWNLAPIGDVTREVDVRARSLSDVDVNEIPVLSLSKDYGLILQSERFGKRIAEGRPKNYLTDEHLQRIYEPYRHRQASDGVRVPAGAGEAGYPGERAARPRGDLPAPCAAGDSARLMDQYRGRTGTICR